MFYRSCILFGLFASLVPSAHAQATGGSAKALKYQYKPGETYIYLMTVVADRDDAIETSKGHVQLTVKSANADEIRMAGQGVPIYATSYDASPSEGAVAVLAGSSSTRINFRAGLSPAESAVVGPMPANFAVGTSITLTVDNATIFSSVVGNSPTGRFVYIWGDAGTTGWNWVRASIVSITPSTKNVRVLPVETGPGGVVSFTVSPTMSLEEAVAIYRDSPSGTLRRTTSSNMTSPLNPVWSPANELATNVTLLNFTYFDRSGSMVTPDTLANRSRIVRVDICLTVQTTQELRNHTRPTDAMAVRSMIRSATIR